MKKCILNGNKVELYDSIEELPMINFQKYNKYLLIDSGIGSDADSIDSHIVKIAKLINKGDSANAIQELQNMRQNLYMINSEISPRYFAFAALVHSINGDKVYDLSDTGLKDILCKINTVKHSKILELLLEFKKKIQQEVEAYFPEDFISVKEKEAYDLLKRKILLILESISQNTDNADAIKQIDATQFSKYKPHNFTGDTSVEIAHDKSFEDTCLIISQKLNLNAKQMTVLEFYSALNLIKRQVETEMKSFKTTKKHK